MEKSIGFVVIPTGIVRTLSRGIYNQIDDVYKTCYDLNKCIPHISLYQAKFRPSKQHEAMQEFVKIVEETSKFSIEMDDLNPYCDSFVFWDCKPNKKLQQLHEKTVKRLSGLREKSESITDFQGLDMPKEQKKNVKKYGYQFAMEQYRPHITITRLKEPRAEGAIVTRFANRDSNVEFEASQIGMCIIGTNGEALELLDYFII